MIKMFKTLGNKPSRFSLPSVPWINNSAASDVESLISETSNSSPSKNWLNLSYFSSLRSRQQVNENDNHPTRIERCLSCFPTLVRNANEQHLHLSETVNLHFTYWFLMKGSHNLRGIGFPWIYKGDFRSLSCYWQQ